MQLVKVSVEQQLERWFEVTNRWAYSELGFLSIGRLVLLCTRAGSSLLLSVTVELREATERI